MKIQLLKSTGIALIVLLLSLPGPAHAAAKKNRTTPKNPVAAPATASDTAINIGQQFNLHSAVLKEDRPYLVYVPDSYHDTNLAPKKYPVLYLLDGDAHFHSASGVIQFMSAGINGNITIPELILVAIPNTDRTRDLTPTQTTRDYSGKASPNFDSSGVGSNFLRFLSQELLPHIEATYRTEPYRILVGHSLGGLLAMQAFLQRPQIFQAHLAIDPSLWWDDQILLKNAKALLQKTNDLRGAVFLSLANNPPIKDFDPKIGAQPSREMADLLQAHNSHQFRSRMQYFETEDHGSVPLLSLYHGLKFIFDGYRPPANLMDNPLAVAQHFTKISERLGYRVLPPENYVQAMSWFQLTYEKATNVAVEFLKLNATNYPDSPTASKRLAALWRRQKPLSEKLSGPFANGIYQLVNQSTGRSLEVVQAALADGARLATGKYTNGLHQQWQFQSQGDGYYQVTNQLSGKALDVSAESLATGAPVLQWSSHGGANQCWQVMPNGDGTYRLLNENSNLALQVAKRGSTNSLEQGEWQARSHQKWRIQPVLPGNK
jgi:uncharacterized protein